MKLDNWYKNIFELLTSYKGFRSRFCVDSRVWYETLEKSQSTYRPKRCEYNNKFSNATTPTCRRERNSFPLIAPLTLDQYLIMLNSNQGSIKYYFWSLWRDSTWDWTLDFRTIGEHCNYYAKMRRVVWIF